MQHTSIKWRGVVVVKYIHVYMPTYVWCNTGWMPKINLQTFTWVRFAVWYFFKIWYLKVCTLHITDTTGSHQFPAMERLSLSKGDHQILSKSNWKEIRSPHFRACIYSCLFCGFKEKPGGAETNLGTNCRGVLYSFTRSRPSPFEKIVVYQNQYVSNYYLSYYFIHQWHHWKHKLPPWCMLNTGERFTGWFANSAGRQQKWGGRSKEGGGL